MINKVAKTSFDESVNFHRQNPSEFPVVITEMNSGYVHEIAFGTRPRRAIQMFQNNLDHLTRQSCIIHRGRVMAIWHASKQDTPRAEAEPVGDGVTWTEAELDQYDPDEPFPPARPGQFVFPPESETYQYEIAALKRKLARAEAALREARDSLLDIRDMAKPYEDNDNFMFSRIVSHAEYGLKQSEGVLAGEER